MSTPEIVAKPGLPRWRTTPAGRFTVLAAILTALAAALLCVAAPAKADVIGWYINGYSNALYAHQDTPYYRMWTIDSAYVGNVTTSRQVFHYVGAVSSSGAWPYTPGSGWNAARDGHAVYQIKPGNSGCVVNILGSYWTRWGDCNNGQNSSLWEVNGAWAVSVYGTNTYSGQWVKDAEPEVMDDTGGGYPDHPVNIGKGNAIGDPAQQWSVHTG